MQIRQILTEIHFSYTWYCCDDSMDKHCECGICGHFNANDCVEKECKCCSNFHLRSGSKVNEK